MGTPCHSVVRVGRALQGSANSWSWGNYIRHPEFFRRPVSSASTQLALLRVTSTESLKTQPQTELDLALHWLRGGDLRKPVQGLDGFIGIERS
jgi:hypothetical protein